MEYYRFEPYLRKALQEYVGMEHREYIDDPNKGPRQFFVSFYDLPRTEKVRSKTNFIYSIIHFCNKKFGVIFLRRYENRSHWEVDLCQWHSH